MKTHFHAALLLAALCVALLTGCASAKAMPRLILSPEGTTVQDPAPQNPTPAATPAQSSVTEPKQITREIAVSTALGDAGLTVNQVTALRTDFDYDHGIPEYEVEFRYEGYEYEYEIHAVTGEILSVSKDRDD